MVHRHREQLARRPSRLLRVRFGHEASVEGGAVRRGSERAGPPALLGLAQRRLQQVSARSVKRRRVSSLPLLLMANKLRVRLVRR